MTSPKVIPNGITVERHRASKAWGSLDKEEREALEASVAQRGVLEPVLAFEVFEADRLTRLKIVDGWHRYQAALKAGRECPYNPVEEGTDAVLLAITANSARRHLTKLVIAVRALKALRWEPDDGRPGRPKTGSDFRFSVAEMAALVGCSERWMRQARNVVREEADLPSDAADWPEGTPERAVAERRDARARRATQQQGAEAGPVEHPSSTPPLSLFDGGEEALRARAQRPKPAQAQRTGDNADTDTGDGPRDEEDEALARHEAELARTAEALGRRADSERVPLDGHGRDALRRARHFVDEAAAAVRRAREVLRHDASAP